MAVRYLDPQAIPTAPAEPYELKIDIAAAPVTVGVISNSFIDAAPFSDHVARELAAALPNLRALRYRKPDTSPASPDMRLQIAEECDAVVSGYGH